MTSAKKSTSRAQNAQIVTNLLSLLQKYVADGRSTPGLRQTNDVAVDIWHDRRTRAQKRRAFTKIPPD